MTLTRATGTNNGSYQISVNAWNAVIDRLDGFVNVSEHGALGDGATDDTTAIDAALDLSSIMVPDGMFIASSLTVPANTQVRTSGFASKIKQKSGTAAETRMVKFGSSNGLLESILFEGQLDQAGDTTGEQNHAVFVALEAGSTASIANIGINDLHGTNIRGDVAYVGSNPTAYTAGYRVSQVSIGKVGGSNVYRNVVSVTGGKAISIDSITGSQVGYMHLDLEPDVGNGPIQGVEVNFIEGRNVGLNSPDPDDYVDGVRIGYLGLDPANSATSDPAYGTTTTYGLQTRNLKYARVDKAQINGFDGPGVYCGNEVGDLALQVISFGQLDLSACCLTDAVQYGYVTGAEDVTRVLVDNLKASVAADKAALLTAQWAHIRTADITALHADSVAFRAAHHSVIEGLRHTGSGSVFVDCDNVVAIKGNVAATAGTFCSFSTDPLFIGYDVTATTLFNTCTHARMIHSTVNGAFYYDLASGVYDINASGDFNTIGKITSSASKIGYATGAGGAVTQGTNRTTGVTLNKPCGSITLVSAAGSASWQSFTVTNSFVAATDVIRVSQKSGTDLYMIHVTNVAAGSFKITYATTGGTTTEQPVFNFAIVQAVAA